jgi:hypothetical protein
VPADGCVRSYHAAMLSIDRRWPGADLIAQGLEDLANGRLTEEALLVTAAAPRLRSVGLEVTPVPVEAPLHRLYELLASTDSADAHARYNALVARVVSFARAAEHAAAS